MKNKRIPAGEILTLTAGILWGISGCVTQYILENFNISSVSLSTLRLLCAGLILVIAGFIKNPKSMTRIWKSKESALRIILYAIPGMMLCQFAYMKSIAETNSGTATVIEYVGPVFIMIATCILSKRLPVKKEIIAIILSSAGIFLIATHGKINTMVITPAGLGWGLLAAVGLMFANMIPGNLTERFGSITVTGYGMFIGGIFLAIASRVWNEPFDTSPDLLIPFAFIILLGTVLPFSIYVKGLSLAGPIKSSMLATVEPVSATLVMVLWLKEPVHPVTLIGFACIITTIFILTKPSKNN